MERTSTDRSRDATTMLALLQAMEGEEELTQRGLAARVGSALGLTNALIKRCIRKGLVKIGEAPARRYAYYLTPKGLSEKSRLVAEYLSFSLNFFRRARADYTDIFATCLSRDWKRVVLVGSGELTEIAILSAQECDLRPLAIIDATRNIDQFLGVPLARALDEVAGVDAVVITDAITPQASFERYASTIPPERLFTPPHLHISRGGNNMAKRSSS